MPPPRQRFWDVLLPTVQGDSAPRSAPCTDKYPECTMVRECRERLNLVVEWVRVGGGGGGDGGYHVVELL